MGQLHLFVFAAVLVLAGCSRPDEKARLRIQLPKATTISQEGKVSAQSGGQWGGIDPVTFADLNCFGVFIGGPEAEMSNNTCYAGQGSSFKKFQFGRDHTYGFFPAGAEITASDLPVGLKKFYVIAARRSANGTCDLLTHPSLINQNEYSNPLLVGTAEKELVPGVNEVVINASLASDLDTQKLHYCNLFSDNDGTPQGLVLRGPIESGSGMGKLGLNTCNKARVVLVSAGESEGFAESEIPVSLSATAGYSFHSDPDCQSSTVTELKFNPGENRKAIYVKAGGTPTTGTISLASANPSFPIGLNLPMETSGGTLATTIRFMEMMVKQAPGSCKAYDFFAVDWNGFTANMGTVFPQVYDIQQGSRTNSMATDMPGSQFMTSCSPEVALTGGTLAVNKASGTLHFKMGSTMVKDFAIGLNSNQLVYVNVEPTASYLAATTNLQPFASACTPVTVKAYDSSNNQVTFDGNDKSPWSVPKNLAFNFYPMGSQSAVAFSDSTCGSTEVSSNFSINNDFQTKTIHYLYGSTAPVTFRGWGGDFISGSTNDFKITVTPRWDPALLPSGSLGVWTRSEDIQSTSSWESPWLLTQPIYNHSGSLGLSIPNGTTGIQLQIPDSSLGTFNSYFFISGGLGAVEQASLSASTFTAAILLRVDTAGEILTFKGASTIATVSSVGTDLNVNGATSPSFFNGQWQVLFVKRSDPGTTIEVRSNNGPWVPFSSLYSDDLTQFIVGTGENPTFQGAVAEVLLVKYDLPDTQVDKIYNYFKQKFTLANLP